MAIEDASDREQIFDLLLRAARSRTRFAALLSVHTEDLRGRRAFADDSFDVSQVPSLRLPRNTVAAFEQAIAARTPTVGPIATGESFLDGFLDALGGAPRAAMILPILLGGRTVAFVVAHRGDADLTMDEVAELFPLVDASSQALSRVLSGRTNATVPAKPRPETEYDVEVTVAGVTQKRNAVAAYRQSESWEELVDAIRELIREGMENGDPDEDEQLDLLLELGQIEAERLGRPARAIEAWRSAQTIDAGNPRVLDALEAIFVQQGRWLECVELLEKRIALTEEKRPRIAMLLNLGALARERLEDDELAIEAYEKILAWTTAADPAHDRAAAELETLYAARDEWQKLTSLLLERAEKHADVQVRIDALKSVATIYEDKLEDPRAAFLVWLAVFRRDPDAPHLFEQLDRLGPLANAWDEILAETRGLAEELEGKHPEAAARMWHLIGQWMRDRLGTRDQAANALIRSLQLNDSDLDTLTELLELLRADGRWQDLVTLLAHRAETEQDPGPRSELYTELAEIYEVQLGHKPEAISYYERALADEPESRTVLVELHRLYLETEAWESLGELLPRLIEALAGNAPSTVIIDLYVELGNVLADHLGRPSEAVEAYRDALALDPKNVAAYQGIERIYQTSGEKDQLLDTREAEADAGTPAEQLQRYPDIARAWHELGRYDRAAACWEKVIALEPRNIAAHAGRAAALRETEHWAGLVVALHSQLRLVADTSDKIALLVELASVLERRLDDVEGAIAAHAEIIGLEPQHRAALDALGRLHDQAGHWQAAIEVLRRLLEITTEPRARGDVLQRIGHAQLAARDATEAQASFAAAIGVDPNNGRAHEGLARVHLQQGKLVAAAEELTRAAQLATSQPETLRLLVDAAWVYRHRLDDAERARACLTRILELDPDHGDAKAALAELLHDTQQWETLWPVLEQELARAHADSALASPDRLDLYTRAARCAVELGKFSQAIELYDLACGIDQSPAMLLERAAALHRSGALDAAAASYQTIATRHSNTLAPEQLVGVYRQLARIHTELGKLPQAQMFHQRVLDIDGAHKETLEELAELHLARGHVDEAIATLRVLAAAAPIPERIGFLERIGDLYRDKLANPTRAITTYLDALELDDKNRRVLQRLLDLQSETRQWKAAVETIGRFLEHETDPVRRGVYYIASAEIRRTELKDRAGALEAYEHALDQLLSEQPLAETTRSRALHAFHAVHELVAPDQNWKYLEQAYRRMIKRLPKNDPILVQLWHSLGDIYRLRLHHPQSAIEAYEVAHSLDPEKSPQRSRVLAELYAQVGGKQAEVKDRAAKLVEVDPTNPDVYRVLGKTALDEGRIDEAWCVARALVVLKQANSQEEALYRRYQAQEVSKARGILDDDTWANVRHPEEDRTISGVFALTWEAAVALKAGPAKSFELKEKERMPVEDGTGVVAKIFRHAARVLNVSLPDVYVQPRRSGRLLLANCIDKGRLAPAVIVGRDLMTGYRDTEIAASVGSMLALLKPAYYLKLTLASADELEAALQAAAQLVGRKLGRPQLEPFATPILAELQKRITRPAAEALLGLVNRLPDQPDLARWRMAVDAAAQRAGLLISGELAATARMLSTEASLGGRPNQRIQDLVAYSVSPAYFAVRRHLGVAVQ
ncbi:MAG TPA: tetratricopeptide repeat protein [Kofleriaceae bacterium]|nr:tetratricopeptide repeat protein [Kofleriaceae bacterium]